MSLSDMLDDTETDEQKVAGALLPSVGKDGIIIADLRGDLEGTLRGF
jgi:hypothetical protein